MICRESKSFNGFVDKWLAGRFLQDTLEVWNKQLIKTCKYVKLRKSHSEILAMAHPFYQRITLGSVADTKGPSTIKCSPNWQLHLWQSGTIYQFLSLESSSWTCAPSVALEKQLTLWHQLAFMPVASSQYFNQLPTLLPSFRL